LSQRASAPPSYNATSRLRIPRVRGGSPLQIEHLESLILFVSDLASAKTFYVDALELPILFEDEIVVVVGNRATRIVLHRDDRGHDERGIFPSGAGVGGAAVRFAVDDPDACEREASQRGLTIVWPTQEATWGRFVVLADPDRRSVVLAKMHPPPDWHDRRS
jgi:predicted enzyme related to lactoylglutathione lyase